MLWLSEIMIQNPDMKDFEELKTELKKTCGSRRIVLSYGC